MSKLIDSVVDKGKRAATRQVSRFACSVVDWALPDSPPLLVVKPEEEQRLQEYEARRTAWFEGEIIAASSRSSSEEFRETVKGDPEHIAAELLRMDKATIAKLADAEFAKAVQVLRDETRGPKPQELAVEARAGRFLSYELEKKSARGARGSGSRLLVQQWIKRMMDSRASHLKDHRALVVEEGGKKIGMSVCKICRQLRTDLNEAMALKKSMPIERTKDESAVSWRRGQEKAVELPRSAASAKPVGAKQAWAQIEKAKILQRSAVEALEVPTVSTSGSYAGYLEDYARYLAFRSQLLQEIEHREAERKSEGAPKKPKVPKADRRATEHGAKPEAKDTEAERAAREESRKRTQNEQKRAAKKAKDERRKTRRRVEALESQKVKLSAAQTSVALAKLEAEEKRMKTKQSKRESKAKDAEKTAVSETGAGPASTSAAGKKLLQNQKKRARQKRVRLAKRGTAQSGDQE